MCAQSAASTRESWRVDISRLLGELWRGAVGAAKKRNSVYNANMEKWKHVADDGAR